MERNPLSGAPIILHTVDATQFQMLSEYVAGAELTMLAALKKALPQYIDDVTREQGNDVYDRMLRDDDVESAMETLKTGILADGITVVPAVDAPQQEDTTSDGKKTATDAKTSDDYKQYIERRLAAMRPTTRALAYELLDGLILGNKVAEKIAVMVESGPDAGKMGFRAIKCRPRHNLSFVVDSFNNLLGFLSIQPQAGIYTLGTQVILGDPAALPNFLPRDKFVVFTHNPKNNDPRGSSIARAAYNPWFIKTQIVPEYFNYLHHFGSPTVVGYTPDNGPTPVYVDDVDVDGVAVLNLDGTTKQISAEMALKMALQKFVNSGVIAVRGGSKVELLASAGEGQAFLNAFRYFGEAIHQAILKTSQASKEAKHSSKASGGIGQDTVDMVILFYRWLLEDCMNDDIVETLMLASFGEESRPLWPRISLSKSNKHDKAAMMTAYANLIKAGGLHESQYPGMDRELDLPERDMAAVAADKALELEIARESALLGQDVLQPNGKPNVGPGETPPAADANADGQPAKKAA